MKQWIFVAMVVVSSMARAEDPKAGTHGTPDTSKVNPGAVQPQPPRQDPFVRLNNLVNACLISQGNQNRSSNLGRSSR